MEKASCMLFLLLWIGAVYSAMLDYDDPCSITNADGDVTDLTDVVPFKWSEALGSPYKYNFYLSLCQQHQGICQREQPRPTFPAYIQQKSPPHGGQPGGCEKNAWFQKFIGGSGGQGSTISLKYEGNPVLNPPVSRAATVNIYCDPSGAYSTLDACNTTVNRVGDVFQYVFSCTGKIACAGAPMGPPPYTPEPGPPGPAGPNRIAPTPFVGGAVGQCPVLAAMVLCWLCVLMVM
eukprot:TRINITY_DN67828_c3_g7_i1.p1 TRINITY_DN67828_c3_g7~~TRINITY_DN67828_c3_g7_i1.p1  ORF type:complete len:234 (+),score=25.37 TRINITY_DN67828_c3_g7_i1:38-739(+)